jgi:hypothetical protein
VPATAVVVEAVVVVDEVTVETTEVVVGTLADVQPASTTARTANHPTPTRW